MNADNYLSDTSDWCDAHATARDYCGCTYRDHDDTAPSRLLILTPASSIKPARVAWLWDGRIAFGTLALLAGREGQGKSTVTAWLIAQVTRGLLPGEAHGTPRTVLVCATEDSWRHTIVPRLMAAGADLERVLQVEIETADGLHVPLGLPTDLSAVERAAREHDVALLVLDPLLSRLSHGLDTHKDADSRRALEPLVAVADSAGFAIVGLMHFNKGGKTDPVAAVMASVAFTAVARSVHTVIRDPDNETRRLFGTPKNNLGRDDLPMLSFTIAGHPIDTPDGTAWTSRAEWGEEVEGTVGDVMARAAEPGDKTATTEAADWLADYLEAEGGRAESAEIKREGAKAGHSIDSLKRARRRLGLTSESSGFPRRTYWATPQSEQPVPPSAPTALTAPTGESPRRGELITPPTTTTPNGPQSAQSAQSEHSPDAVHRLDAAATCPHGLPSGAEPDPWLNGRLACPECAAELARGGAA